MDNILTPWQRNTAAGIARIGPNLGKVSQRMFCIEVDWIGGGFVRTLPFRDVHAAAEWAVEKAEGRQAVVSVTELAANDEPDSTSQPERA